MTSIEIDGAIFTVCYKCVKLGKPIISTNTSPENIQKPNKIKISNNKPTNNFYDSDFEIVKDFSTLIRKAREQKKLSQEELGSKLNEKPSVIRTLESGKLKPTDILAKKIERFLNLKILITSEE